MDVNLMIRTTAEMAAAFGALAARQRLTTSELLRQLIVTVLAGKGAPAAPAVSEAAPNLPSRMKTRLTFDTKAAWQQRARQLGIAPSQMLRNAIAAVLARNPIELTAPVTTDKGEDEPMQRIQLSLKPAELAAVDTAAGRLGWRRNTWIVGVIRTATFSEPRLTDRELEAVHRSNSELAAIGRNLNQIARAMHRDDRYKESVTLERIDKLREQVTENIERSSSLLEAAENRWSPPERFRPETK